MADLSTSTSMDGSTVEQNNTGSSSSGNSSSGGGALGAGAGAGAGARDTTNNSTSNSSASSSNGSDRPIVGACYNVFDGIELLEYSIKSLQPVVSYVVVVAQRVSNFGARMDPVDESTLKDLVKRGLVNDVIWVDRPRVYKAAEKKALVSPRATGADLGMVEPSEIGDQFFNELSKREQGRQACLDAGCSYFMSIDVDEFYVAEDLAKAIQRMVEKDYHCGLCRMEYYFKHPRWQLRPHDDTNYVTAIFKCVPEFMFRLGCPYPFLIDPTRRCHNVTRLVEFQRDELVMHHMSFVRNNILSKVNNVSNRGNYADIGRFIEAFLAWRPGHAIVHPHAYYATLFKTCEVVEDRFAIPTREMPTGLVLVGDIDSSAAKAAAAAVLAQSTKAAEKRKAASRSGKGSTPCASCGKPSRLRCSRCRVVQYCSPACQKTHWKSGHKKKCVKPSKKS